jgi:hypothetical protein
MPDGGEGIILNDKIMRFLAGKDRRDLSEVT